MTAAGEIDISTVSRLHERPFEIAARSRPVVVDLDQISFIDSIEIAMLVGAANRAAVYGGCVQVACSRPKIGQLLRLTGLDCRIPLARTLTRAWRPSG